MTDEEKAAQADKLAARRADYDTQGDDAPWIPKRRLDEATSKIAAEREAEKARADKLAAELAEASKAAAERDQLRADLANTRLSAAFEVAAIGAGLSDPDDVQEFRDRYDRLHPGEDGKRPTPREWMAAIKEKPPKWARAYLDAPKDDEVEDPPGVRQQVAQERRQEPAVTDPAKKQDPNAGTRQAGGGGHRRITDEAAVRMTGEEWRQVRGTVAKDLLDAGQIRMSDADKKLLGLS